MMHEVTVRSINVSKPVRLALPEFDHQENQGPRFRKRTRACTRVCTDGIVGFRWGGTCTPFVGS